jgi:hypothetical protein
MFDRLLADGADRRSASVRRYPSGAPPVAAAACALYLTVLSLYGERPCLAHAAINSCRGLGDSTEPHPKVTPPYAFGSTTTPAPHNGHSAFGERTTSGTSHSRRHSVRMRTGRTLRLTGQAHSEPLGTPIGISEGAVGCQPVRLSSWWFFGAVGAADPPVVLGLGAPAKTVGSRWSARSRRRGRRTLTSPSGGADCSAATSGQLSCRPARGRCSHRVPRMGGG